MSRNRMLAATAAILATLLLCVVSPASAEVFALQGPDGSYAGTRTVQPDRPGSSAWTPLGLAQASWLALNLDGERRGDDPPVIVHDPRTGLPFVAWASRSVNGDRDISLAAFDGHDWRLLPAVGGRPGRDDFEPALAVFNGSLLVVWTEGRRNPSIWAASGNLANLSEDGEAVGTSFWSLPVQISPPGVWAHAPSILVGTHQIVIASIGRGRPQIRFDLLPIMLPDASDGPTPLPPVGLPSSPLPPPSVGSGGTQPSGATTPPAPASGDGSGKN